MVRAGYKQTEVGILPNEWKADLLGKYATFRTGPFGSTLHKSDYVTNGIPVVNPMHIVNDRIEPTHTMTITEEAAQALSEFRIKFGEIVIGRRGDMGRCAVVKEHNAGWLCGTGAMIIRPVHTDARFLQRVLSSTRSISAIEDASVGTTMINLNQGTLAGLMIPVPPISEQLAIAEALSDADAWIESLEKLIAKKHLIKQGAMQELLSGKKRLPGFCKEWNPNRLGKFVHLQVGFPFGSTYFNTDGHGERLIKNRDLKNDDQPFYYSGSADNAYLVKDGDLLVGMDGDFILCLWHKGNALLNQRVGRIIAHSHINLSFVYFYLAKPLKDIEASTSSTTVKHLSHGDIEDIELKLPEFEEQAAIAEALLRIDSEISALEQKLAKARAIKQGMMQELLTGRIRLI